jgi:hypothetical protein
LLAGRAFQLGFTLSRHGLIVDANAESRCRHWSVPLKLGMRIECIDLEECVAIAPSTPGREPRPEPRTQTRRLPVS